MDLSATNYEKYDILLEKMRDQVLRRGEPLDWREIPRELSSK